MKKLVLGAIFLITAILSASAEIKTETVSYKSGGTELEGFHAYDAGKTGKRPAVLVVHQWKGLTAYEQMRAKQLAELGYNVFALDIYGKGIRPADAKEAAAEAGKYKNDRKLYRERLAAGLKVLHDNEFTDTSKIAAIGYCFGGQGVLELVRDGADLKGVVSFHGALNAAAGSEASKSNTRVLACHGADDPFVPPAEVAAFEEEMRKAGIDWQLIAYGGAVHSFTQKEAGNDNSKGSAYNEKADHRSWESMKSFFAEIFR